ncbi:MAG: GIY-YIG nuclease family protein [Cyclobacteriaceae bacterium]
MKFATWRAPGYLYIFDVNGMTKFGITTNLERRIKQYRKMVQDLPMQTIKVYSFDHYWQAELVESMMRFRLRNWAMQGRYEWLVDLTLQQVIDCYRQIISVVEPEYDLCECFHYHTDTRYAHYKNFFRMFTDKFDQVDLS